MEAFCSIVLSDYRPVQWCALEKMLFFFSFFPPTGLSIDNCSKLQQRKTCFQSAVLFFCFSGNTVQKPEIRTRMSEVRLVLDLSVYLRWESFFLASSHICTFFQSGRFWKIYPEVTIQDQWNGVAMLADVLTPYPLSVCLVLSLWISPASTHTHARPRAHTHREHMPSVTQMSIVWSDPTAACHSLWAC